MGGTQIDAPAIARLLLLSSCCAAFFILHLVYLFILHLVYFIELYLTDIFNNMKEMHFGSCIDRKHLMCKQKNAE